MQKIFLEEQFSFDAAHFLEGYQGKCSRLHGHRWTIDVCVSGTQLNHLGLLMDFKDLAAVVDRILPDHEYLNELPEFYGVNPTAENLAKHFYSRLGRLLPEGIQIERVRVWESPTACAYVERGIDCGRHKKLD